MQVRTLIYCHPCSSEVQQGANPYALILTTTNGQIENKRILKTNRFDFERSMESPGWGVKLHEEVNSEVDEYALAPLSIVPAAPFTLVASGMPCRRLAGLLRAKGGFWLATRLDRMGIWSQSGPIVRLNGGNFWWAGLLRSDFLDEASDSDSPNFSVMSTV